MRGSVTRAVALFGLYAWPTPRRTSSALAWICASSVSCTSCPGFIGVVSRMEIASPRASRTIRRSPSLPCSVLLLHVLQARAADAVGLHGAEDLRRQPVARVLAAARRREVDARDVAARGPSRRALRAACARGRRSRCASVSLSSRSSAGTPRIGASFAAVPRGSFTRYGVAETSLAGSETASSTPLRSVIEPRCAGSATSATCCVAAALRRVSALDEPDPCRRAGRRWRGGRGRPRRGGRCDAA